MSEHQDTFNTKNTATPNDMLHVAFMNTDSSTAEKTMEPFNISFPIGRLVQPSPLGVTFFHVDADDSSVDITQKLARQLEEVTLTNVHKDFPIDVFVIATMHNNYRSEDISEHVVAANKITPEAHIFILSSNEKKTQNAIKDAGLEEYVNHDNIVPINSGELLQFLKDNTDIKESYQGPLYENAAALREQYTNTLGAETNLKATIHSIESANEPPCP